VFRFNAFQSIKKRTDSQTLPAVSLYNFCAQFANFVRFWYITRGKKRAGFDLQLEFSLIPG